MPGTSINQINYDNKVNQQTSNDIDGILNEVQYISRNGGNTGQYNPGSTNPVIKVSPVPKQFQYNPTPPPPQQMQQPMQQPMQQQMEQFQSGPVQQHSGHGQQWEWAKSMKLTLLVLLLLGIFFNPFINKLWEQIPFIAENPKVGKFCSGILFCLSFYLISLFI